MDPTTRWILILGIAALCFGLALFVLRVPVRTILVFFAIGVPLIILWLYADEKSKQQKRINKITNQRCICSICKHEQARVCLDQKCACCIMMKGSDIMGHSINPLQ
jgi:membrane protein implicated in regulation of membrane protease activity